MRLEVAVLKDGVWHQRVAKHRSAVIVGNRIRFMLSYEEFQELVAGMERQIREWESEHQPIEAG